MSAENVEILKHSFEDAPENPEPFFAMFDENVESDMSGDPFPIQKKVYGPEAVREFFRTWAGTFDDWGFGAEEVIDAGSSVFVCLHQSGRGKGSGIPVENRFYTGADVRARQGDSLSGVDGQDRSPRSRRAAGVGDVAGERRDRTSRLRGVERGGHGGSP